MPVAVVLAANTCVTNIGKKLPLGTLVKTIVVPPSIITSTSPLLPLY